MKKILLFILITKVIVLNAQQYWLVQSSPVLSELLECFFTDSAYGWVCGDSGTIIATSNGGTNWILQPAGSVTNKIEDIFFINRRLGWATGTDQYNFKSYLLNTTNGGLIWKQNLPPDTNYNFGTVYFLDSLRGFISGYSGKIFRTTNAGFNWIQCYIDTTECLYGFPKKDFYFMNSQTGFACGGVFDVNGVIWRTNDGGLNWNSFCLGSEPVSEIKLTPYGRIVAMGGDFEYGSNYIYTTNSGASWNVELTNCFGNATGFSFRTPAEVWTAQSFSPYWAVNLDSMKPGTIWQCIPTPNGAGINDVEFLSPTLGWAFGARGTILKYNTSVTGINGNNNSVPKLFELEQNYPNPFNPVTKIKFSIPVIANEVKQSQNVSLIIFDVLGKEVAILVNEELQPGTYEVTFDGTNYPSGIYFYKLDVNTPRPDHSGHPSQEGIYTETKKMVILK